MSKNWKRWYQKDRKSAPPARIPMFIPVGGTYMHLESGEYLISTKYEHATYGVGTLASASIGANGIVRVTLQFSSGVRTFPLYIEREIAPRVRSIIGIGESDGLHYDTRTGEVVVSGADAMEREAENVANRRAVNPPRIVKVHVIKPLTSCIRVDLTETARPTLGSVGDGRTPDVPLYYRVKSGKRARDVGRLLFRLGESVYLVHNDDPNPCVYLSSLVEQLSAADALAIDGVAGFLGLGELERYVNGVPDEAQHRGELGVAWRQTGQVRQKHVDYADDELKSLSATPAGRQIIRDRIAATNTDLVSGEWSNRSGTGPGKAVMEELAAAEVARGLGVGASRDAVPERASSVKHW